MDITNYVMLEYGQPLHAFDFDKCRDNTIIVRSAREGETLTTLDGEARELNPPMLTIADSRDSVGLAGVMGGANSEMTGQTTSVLLESASFNPVNTRRTRTALGMRTDASDRFERDIRSALAPIALRRATGSHSRTLRRKSRQGNHRPLSYKARAAQRETQPFPHKTGTRG